MAMQFLDYYLPFSRVIFLSLSIQLHLEIYLCYSSRKNVEMKLLYSNN